MEFQLFTERHFLWFFWRWLTWDWDSDDNLGGFDYLGLVYFWLRFWVTLRLLHGSWVLAVLLVDPCKLNLVAFLLEVLLLSVEDRLPF